MHNYNLVSYKLVFTSQLPLQCSAIVASGEHDQSASIQVTKLMECG